MPVASASLCAYKEPDLHYSFSYRHVYVCVRSSVRAI